MKKMKKTLVVVMLLIFTLSILGCSNAGKQTDKEGEDTPKIDTMKRIQDNKKIIWGTNAAFAPFEMREGDEVIGIDAEIGQKIAEKLGVELVVEDMEFDSLIAALQSGKIDYIAAGFTVRPDREEQVLFADKYFKAVQAIIVQEGNTEIATTEDLKGKKIGVQNGTSGDYLATDDIEGADVVRYNNGIEAALDLKNGNIDAVIIDNLPAEMLVDSNPGLIILDEKPADEEEYAFAIRKGDTELQGIINEVLKEMVEKGEIEALVNKYSMGQ